MVTRDTLSAYRWFRQHGGGGVVGHDAETCLRLARAEIAARQLDWQVIWEYDCDPAFAMDGHEDWCGCDEPGRHEIEQACVYDADGNVLASLGGIIDADRDYRRIVNAELASEALYSQHVDPRRMPPLYQCIGA